MDSISNNIIIAGIFTIIGGLIGAIAGGIIACLISNRTIKKQIFISAGNDFRAEFNGTLFRLNPTYNQIAPGIFKEFYGQQEIAKDKFIPFLKIFSGGDAVKRFKVSWDDYCNYKDTNNMPWVAYEISDTQSQSTSDMKDLMKNKILKLFEFTEL